MPTSTPRWHHAEGTFFGGLPCIGIIEIPMHERERVKLLERENRQLRQANEILRKASPGVASKGRGGPCLKACAWASARVRAA
ncbi:hypothetical protein FFH21_028905 (plasmid) [Pseudomonas sp. KBS0707]|nr:hypothetical protein FFH21_028905 [Pseudomonas sp. KBS0707]